MSLEENNHNRGHGSGEIRGRAEDCQSLFVQCISNPRFSKLDWFENRHGDLNLWSASLKATSLGRASLDYRLRDRPDVREMICDLLDGLSEALISLLQPLVSSEGSEDGAKEESDSVFSAFSTDNEDTASLSDISKVDGPFSEQMFNVKTTLGQLARISTAIRRSGSNYRYQKADSSLREDDFEEFKTHWTIIILLGNSETREERPADNSTTAARLMDVSRLTAVQERLVQANMVRMNRIIFATKSMKAAEKSALQEARQRVIIPTSDLALQPTSQQRVTPSKSNASKSVASTKAPSIISPSVTQTATEIGSQLNLDRIVESKKSHSVITNVTRTGASQDYPRCPNPISDEHLQCPYCADMLPASYLKHPSRWKGHVAHDILPYICIYNDCEISTQMYLTSDELIKHMLSKHGVTRWVCDYCASESAVGDSFVFESMKDWELHMKKAEHTTAFIPSQLLPLSKSQPRNVEPLASTTAFTSSQLLLLSKVSQRTMLEPQNCPLCGYVGDHHSSTLDDHIAKHLHGFALRCLPWGAGGDDADSVKAKSADASISSENSVGDDPAYLDVMADGEPAQLFESLAKLSESERYDEGCMQQVRQIQKALAQHLPLLGSSVKLRRDADHVARQSAEARHKRRNSQTNSQTKASQLGTLLVDSNRPGYLLDYSDETSLSLSHREELCEAANLHLFQVICILHQANVDWGAAKVSKDAFELYCKETRSSLTSDTRAVDIENELTRRWTALASSGQAEFSDRLERDMEHFREYIAENSQASQIILTEELSALAAALSGLTLELATAASQATASVSQLTEPEIFIKPFGFRPNKLFVGRERELKKLHQMLFDKTRRSLGTSAVIIQCLPGGGKTHLARQYVYEHRDDFPGGIFWLRAGSEQELVAGIWDIARKVVRPSQEDVEAEPTSFIEIVREWLNKRHHWLLVLDKVHFNEELRKFIPDSPNTSLIYTSTEQGSHEGYHFMNPRLLKLPLLSAREAQTLFLLELDKQQPFAQDDLKYSMELVRNIGFLPVVIRLVALRLKETDEPLSKFARRGASENALRGLTSYRAVIDELEKTGATEALNLMRLVCFFSQNIPVEMIVLGQRVLDVPIRAHDPVGGRSLNKSLRVLSLFALLERNEHESPDSEDEQEPKADNVDIIRLHITTQGFFIDTLREDDTLAQWLDRAIRLFCESYDAASIRASQAINCGLTEDFRLYHIHGIKLREHLQKIKKEQLLGIDGVSIGDVRSSLELRLRAIEGEIQRRTADARQQIVGDGFRMSVFERTRSTTDSGPSTPPFEVMPSRSDFLAAGYVPGLPEGQRLSPESMSQDYTQRFGVKVPHRINQQSSAFMASPSSIRVSAGSDPGYDTDEEESANLNTQQRRAIYAIGEEPGGSDDWQVVSPRPRRKAPSFAQSEDLSLERSFEATNQHQQSQYNENAGVFRATSSDNHRVLRGQATQPNVRVSRETSRGYLEKGSTSEAARPEPYRSIVKGPSAAEAALAKLAKEFLPPSKSGSVTKNRQSSESKKTPRRPLLSGASSYAAAVSGVNMDTASGYKKPPEAPSGSGKKPV